MLNNDTPIASIRGHEPNDARDIVMFHRVGYAGVTAIKVESEYGGNGPLTIFGVYAGEKLVAHVSILEVAEVVYQQEATNG